MWARLCILKAAIAPGSRVTTAPQLVLTDQRDDPLPAHLVELPLPAMPMPGGPEPS